MQYQVGNIKDAYLYSFKTGESNKNSGFIQIVSNKNKNLISLSFIIYSHNPYTKANRGTLKGGACVKYTRILLKQHVAKD